MTRIVVGIDGSHGSRAALEWALHYAKANNGEIDAVLAYDPQLAWIDIGSDYEHTWREYTGERVRTQLQSVLDELGDTGVVIRQHIIEDAPAKALIEAATGADLLVVGTRGRGTLASTVLGSVSHRCAEHAPCPVVVVPS